MFTTHQKTKTHTTEPVTSRQHLAENIPLESKRGGSVSQALERSLGNSLVQRNASSGNPTGTCAGGQGCHCVNCASPANVTLEDPTEMEQTTCTSSTSGNGFDITFDPSTTTPRPQANEIQFIQSIQMTADGTAMNPGTYYSRFAYRDPTAISDSTYIDHLASFRTPYLAENGHGTAGFSNSGSTGNATFHDAPNTGGGDRGFKTSANPTGWNTVVYNFQTLAFATVGTDCGTWYDGIGWTYTKTAADQVAGSNGTSSGFASLLGPSASTQAAFDRFNSVKGFTPCTSSVAPGP
ncbi:MAG TPA: hypothetical protein PKD12_02190 [Nitrospira sp.]|nr:hypothetical protein [Nitrospira sp.]